MTFSGSKSRIAKRLSRSGVGSRRDCERLVRAGQIKINGVTVINPATTVTDQDTIEFDGKELSPIQGTRLWKYHKPAGLVTTRRDERNRPTIFDCLPAGLPYVMPVGRLDMSSEGLLLLTNDGEFKRFLELPATGLKRRYRVRVRGNPTTQKVRRLENGIVVGSIQYAPMTITLDKRLGANCWMTIDLQEGKNREIRKALSALRLEVNRLIRISYGPLELGTLQKSQLLEVDWTVLAKTSVGRRWTKMSENEFLTKQGPSAHRRKTSSAAKSNRRKRP